MTDGSSGAPPGDEDGWFDGPQVVHFDESFVAFCCDRGNCGQTCDRVKVRKVE